MTLYKFLKKFSLDADIQIKVNNVGTVHTGAVIAIPARYVLKPYTVRKASLVLGTNPYIEIVINRPKE